MSSKLTIPQSPKLRTLTRNRPSYILSAEEREAEEMKKMPKFKARPLNKKIFESSGTLGVPRLQKPPPTQPREPALATSRRAGKHRPATAPVATAQPKRCRLRSEILERPDPLPDIAPKPSTRPQPFALHTEDRGEGHVCKATEQRARELDEEQRQREFIARPLPIGDPMMPKPSERPLTEFAEFGLRTEERGTRKVEEYQQMLEDRDVNEYLDREFLAQPNRSKGEAFVPAPSSKPLTEFTEFKQYSDRRSQQRADFDQRISEKEAAQKEAARLRELEAEAEEKKAVAELRKSMVFKARPMPRAVATEVKASVKPLTIPESPMLLTRKRTRS